jgi:hypothetical protein
MPSWTLLGGLNLMPSRLDARRGWPSVDGDSTELEYAVGLTLWLQVEEEIPLKQDERLEADRAVGGH